MALLKVYRCRHCQSRFVVMQTPTGQLLPIEVTDQQFDEEEIFNWKKHKSHLLECIPRRMDWNDERKKFKDRMDAENILDLSVRSSTKFDLEKT